MIPNGFLLRPARDEDSAAFLAILEAVFAEYPGCVLVLDEEPEMQQPASAFAALGGQIWALEGHGQVLGMVALQPSASGVVELKKLYLLPPARGQGLGRALIEHVEEEARRLGARRVHLWSDTRFTTAHRVYEHLGYRRLPETRALHDASATIEFHYEKKL
ncbi:MAG: GNAT family N-acetyltransferase [Myxococcales bacterium]|nr:GNAT family N-acetyltransferase [Polyangiaceae bacterium]MDW8247910.1 GNAT family N-acetyltransferase [Myxococcales bacterium]